MKRLSLLIGLGTLVAAAVQLARARIAVLLWPMLICYAGAQATGRIEGRASGQMDLLTGSYSFRENGVLIGDGSDEISIVAEGLSIAPASRLPLLWDAVQLQGQATSVAVLYAARRERSDFAILSEDPGEPPLVFGRPLEMVKFQMGDLTISTADGTRLAIARLDLAHIRTGFGFRAGLASLSATGHVLGLDLSNGMLLSGDVVISNGYAVMRGPQLDCGRGKRLLLQRAVIALTPPFSSEIRPATGCNA